jgi:hypothetical protein
LEGDLIEVGDYPRKSVLSEQRKFVRLTDVLALSVQPWYITVPLAKGQNQRPFKFAPSPNAPSWSAGNQPHAELPDSVQAENPRRDSGSTRCDAIDPS